MCVRGGGGARHGDGGSMDGWTDGLVPCFKNCGWAYVICNKSPAIFTRFHRGRGLVILRVEGPISGTLPYVV